MTDAATDRAPSFARLNQVDAGVLSVGYAEARPSDGPAVVLLHGWLYDIHSYADVAPLLAAQGYRVMVPHLRGTDVLRSMAERAGATITEVILTAAAAVGRAPAAVGG